LTTRRIAAAFWMVLAPCVAVAAAPPPQLQEDAATEAIVRIRWALPDGWVVADIQWNRVPEGWSGDSTAVFLRLEDETLKVRHPEHGFDYHPFYKIWIVPALWEGRMQVAPIDPRTPHAFFLGESGAYRLLFRTLGNNTWLDGPQAIAKALRLDSFPMDSRAAHTVDVDAMQRLYRRLDTTSGAFEGWQRRIWGIEELPDLVYLELLTWDERSDAAEDPTSLGKIPEQQTAYLARETLAAFPDKRAVYVRRLTEKFFSDVLVVNRTPVAATP
jgi:hypothetical protein